MRKILFLFAAISSLCSCTITKRQNAPGYHVDCKLFRDNALEVPLPGSQVAKVHWSESCESIQCDFFFIKIGIHWMKFIGPQAVKMTF